MRIAIIADRLIMGGLETHLMTFVNELIKRGHSILLNAAYINPEWLRKIIDPSNAASTRFVYVPWSENPVDDVKGFHPDIVHSHPFTAIFRGFETAKALSKPFFITIHGMYDFGVDRSPLGNQVSALAQKIIAVDEGVAALLVKCTAHPEKISVIFNGIDMSEFAPRPLLPHERIHYGLVPEWKTLVIVSRLSDGKEKPILDVLHVIPELAMRLGGVNVMIIGDGTGFTAVKNQADSLNARNNVRIFLGGSCQDVRPFLALADLVLACDRAAMEAFACQRAVFAMNASGFGGPIDHRNFQTILFHRQGYQKYSPAKLINELFTLLKNQNQRNMLGREGYQLVARYFNIVNVADQLLRLYGISLR